MASIDLMGMDELMADLLSSADLPVEEMLETGADVAMAAQKKTGEAMGVHKTGAVLGSLKKHKPVVSSRHAYIKIEFAGTQHKTRNAEVAFINEYGKTNQPARPFISVANEEAAGDIAVAEYRIFDEHLKKHNL